jgi:hypothetical protein
VRENERARSDDRGWSRGTRELVFWGSAAPFVAVLLPVYKSDAFAIVVPILVMLAIYRLSRRFRPEPYPWPGWVSRARLEWWAWRAMGRGAHR